MALLPLFAGTPLVLTPALVMFLEMIINPASSIVFESEHGERDLMLRPPRKPGEALFGARAITYALVQGLGLLLACMATFFITTAQGSAHEQARAAVFITMVLGNLAMILVSRSNHTGLLSLLAKPNPAQWWLVGASLVALVLVIGVPWLAESFSFGMPDLAQIGVALLAALAALSWLEMVKFIFSHRTRGVKP
jgi:Ca2+-transporting ATPase